MRAGLDLAPDESGLKDWTYDDFEQAHANGGLQERQPLEPFMPIDVIRNFDDVETRAPWTYLWTLAPVPPGGR